MNALERPPVAPGLSAGHPTPKEPRLPPLREDLRLHEGPDADDGSPTWVLEDPARDQFFQLGVFQAECLKRWHLGTAKAVAAAVGKETLLRPTAETVENFAKFLMRMSLTREAGTSARLAEQMKRKPQADALEVLSAPLSFFPHSAGGAGRIPASDASLG